MDDLSLHIFENPEWRSRLKKDPGIPNLFPYKDRLLHEIEEKKRLKEEQGLQKNEEARGLKGNGQADNDVLGLEVHNQEDPIEEDEAMDEDSDADQPANPMGALLASARARAVEYENAVDNLGVDMDDDVDDDVESGDDIKPVHDFRPLAQPPAHESSRRAYDKIFKAVLSSSDIVLYILDARDPNGTRSREIEKQITAAEAGSKRLILVLNKIDLVPPAVLKAWITYLRLSFPTIPLRASHPAPNARTFDHNALTQKATSEILLRALKSYAHSQQLKRSITVGIIGYPNVGKSSVINALTSRLSGSASSFRSNATACPVGAEAGITTALREVKLDNKLKLLDSPGIVFPSSSSANLPSQAHLTLLNALPPKQISDPLPAISLLLTRPAILPSLLQTYDIPPVLLTDGDPTTDFLVQVARKKGRLGKGGVPNVNSAAMSVLNDWRDGRIQGWTEAPEADAGEKQVVRDWAAEFKLEGLWGDDDKEAVEIR